jgi:hypothetical protein
MRDLKYSWIIQIYIALSRYSIGSSSPLYWCSCMQCRLINVPRKTIPKFSPPNFHSNFQRIHLSTSFKFHHDIEELNTVPVFWAWNRWNSCCSSSSIRYKIAEIDVSRFSCSSRRKSSLILIKLMKIWSKLSRPGESIHQHITGRGEFYFAACRFSSSSTGTFLWNSFLNAFYYYVLIILSHIIW